MAEMMDDESEDDYDSKSNHEGGKHIIDVEPNATISTTKFWSSDQEEP
jgi:hypothetical protein